MAKPKAAAKIAFNVRLDQEVYEELRARRAVDETTITAIVDAALRQYMSLPARRTKK